MFNFLKALYSHGIGVLHSYSTRQYLDAFALENDAVQFLDAISWGDDNG